MNKTDEHLRLVFQALDNTNYDWRTVAGIAKETGLDESEVSGLLTEHSDQIVRSSVPDVKGKALYTTRDRYYQARRIPHRILSIFADRIK